MADAPSIEDLSSLLLGCLHMAWAITDSVQVCARLRLGILGLDCNISFVHAASFSCPDAHGPSYGGVWGLKSLNIEGPRAVNGASGYLFFSTINNHHDHDHLLIAMHPFYYRDTPSTPCTWVTRLP